MVSDPLPPERPPVVRQAQRCGELVGQHPLGVRLVGLGHRLSYLIDRRLGRHDLNRTQAMIVMALRRHPGLMAQDLAGPVRVEPPNVTRAIQTLERRDLVTRRPHPTDGRASLFYLRPAGEDMAKNIELVWRETSDELEAGLTPEQRQALFEGLDALSARIESLWSEASGDPRGALEGDLPPRGEGPPPPPRRPEAPVAKSAARGTDR